MLTVEDVFQTAVSLVKHVLRKQNQSPFSLLPLPGRNITAPFVFGDAFSLSENILKPFQAEHMFRVQT